MSYEDVKQRGRSLVIEILVFIAAYLLIVNVVLPRLGFKGG